MLDFIRKLPQPVESDLKPKLVEFGDYTRQKTLIFDMDETLINAFPIDDKKKKSLDFGIDFEFTLPNGH